MNYKYLVAITLTLYLCCNFSGHCQKGMDYDGIETENVLSYKVDEIIVMRFGGSSTHYNVSNIRLISRVDLGPGNIRIISPVYKDGTLSKKTFVEVMSKTKKLAKYRQKNAIFEITVENNQTKIANNPNATPAETEALLAILKKVIPDNKVAYEKTQVKDPRQNGTKQKNKTSPRTSAEKLVNQNTSKTPETAINIRAFTKNQSITQSKPVDVITGIKISKLDESVYKKSRIRPERIYVSKAQRISINKTPSKLNTSDSLYRSIRETKLKMQKENGSRLIKERDVAAKLRRNPIQKNSLGTNKNDSITAARKEARLTAQKQREERAKSNALEGKSESTKNRTSRLLKEKHSVVSVTEVIDQKISKKEPRIKSKKKPENRSRGRVKSRKRGKIKVAEESSDLTRVRYDKMKYAINTKAVNDSAEISRVKDSLKIAKRKKTELSSKSFNFNKVRNNKVNNTNLKRDLKESVSMDSRKGVLVTIKKEKKIKDVSPDSLAINLKSNRNLKESATKKEVITRPFILINEVSKIKAITRDVTLSMNDNALKPSTVFSLSTMIPLSISKVDSLSIKPPSVVVNVIATYERVAKKGYKSVDLFQKIADSYFFNGDMETAVLWYEKLFDLTEKLDPVYYYRFGTALQKVGKVIKGDSMIEKFNQLKK